MQSLQEIQTARISLRRNYKYLPYKLLLNIFVGPLQLSDLCVSHVQLVSSGPVKKINYRVSQNHDIPYTQFKIIKYSCTWCMAKYVPLLTASHSVMLRFLYLTLWLSHSIPTASVNEDIIWRFYYSWIIQNTVDSKLNAKNYNQLKIKKSTHCWFKKNPFIFLTHITDTCAYTWWACCSTTLHWWLSFSFYY